MNRCRRPLILITLLLLTGAVVNTIVAWGASVRASVAWERGQSAQAPFPAISGAADWPVCNTIVRSGGFGFDETIYLATGPLNDAFQADLWSLEVHRAGWPMRSLCWYDGRFVAAAWDGGLESDSTGYIPLKQPRLFGASSVTIRDARLADHPVDLPIDPLPIGFAINTLFYAAILALPLTVFPFRRHLRARRGRCPTCGDDLAGLRRAQGGPPLRGGRQTKPNAATPCPECGPTR